MGGVIADVLTLRRRYNGSYNAAEADEINNLLTAQGMPPYTDIVRRGKGWSVQTATAFAPGVAQPSTVAKLEVKNNTTQLFVIDRVWAQQLLSTAADQAYSVWAQVGAAVVSAVTALVVYPMNGVGKYTSVLGGDLITAIDQTVVANGWQPFATQEWGLAAATPGGTLIGNVEGRLVVPPGLAVHVMVEGSIATASSFHCGVSGFFYAGTNET